MYQGSVTLCNLKPLDYKFSHPVLTLRKIFWLNLFWILNIFLFYFNAFWSLVWSKGIQIKITARPSNFRTIHVFSLFAYVRNMYIGQKCLYDINIIIHTTIEKLPLLSHFLANPIETLIQNFISIPHNLE